MSKGPGRVQRAITAAFEAEPTRRFTTAELAAIAYPGTTVEKNHTDAVHRALTKLTAPLGLTKSRIALPNAFGWQHLWGRIA